MRRISWSVYHIMLISAIAAVVKGHGFMDYFMATFFAVAAGTFRAAVDEIDTPKEGQ